ncbi:hypothetical protein JCM10908_003059 [Rhodotorula pacifica]|uniref:uncharacterized protein n=1 Tax=Rhodotorula pacifica TaxID=1495444 RepID=UPI00317ADA3B
MPSSPMPVNLPQECRKAQKIFQSFVDPHNGLDHVVPPSVLRRAKGFCLMSVAKAGFGFSARAGSGVVIARLQDGSWSAPSAVGTAGGGFGFQAGVELAEFLIILNSSAAVKTFMSKGSLMVGGNLSVAAGPLGRNVEGTGSLSAKGKVAAMYSYSRTKGLFGGASVEGSVLVERSDANAKAYGSNVTATQLLSGSVDPPEWAYGLITTISNLATGSVALPGGGWGLDSPMNTPTPGADEDIDNDEQGYFSRSRIEREKSRREESDRTEHGLTPREYQERGYAFANSYASGGSNSIGRVGTPEKEKSQIRSMLGAVGRNRSGSGASSTKKSASTQSAAVEDPFAGGEDDRPIASRGPVHAGYTNFETQFSNDFDDDDEPLRQPRFNPNGGSSRSMSRDASSTGIRGSSPPRGDSRSRDRNGSDLMSFDSDLRASSTSPSRSRNRSRAGSSASAGGGSWFSRNSRPKLPKTKSSSASNGLRERAEQMRWGNEREGAAVLGSGGGRDSFDDLDEDDFGGRPRYENGVSSRDQLQQQGRFRASTVGAGPGTVSAFDRAALSNQSRNRSASSPLKPRQNEGKSSYGPFDSNTSLSSTDGGAHPSRAERNAYSAKPWDSEDEAFVATSPPHISSSTSARASGTSSPAGGRARSGTTTSASARDIDLRQVEADFAGVLSLSKHGGSGEVGSYSAGTGSASRSRSSTIGGAGAGTNGTGSRSGSGGRSRSGTAGGGIGQAIALYDFPGVEPTDLPFKKGEVITILARDDEEWWKGRLRLREGMIPRNYVEAHFA